MNTEIDPGLLRARPRMIYVEMTSRCNARCVYCPVSQPDYQGSDLEMEAEELAELLIRCHPGEVQLSGHGETTLLPAWTQTARLLMNQGLPMTLTSNLAKKMSDEEIDVLGRFRALKISVDSADPDLAEKLRRGVSLAQLEDNLARIILNCREHNRDLPYLHISCTVTQACLEGIPDLVRWSKEHGAHALALVNLARHPDPPGAMPILHPAEVDPRRALEILEEARALADELDFTLDVEPGLWDSLREAN